MKQKAGAINHNMLKGRHIKERNRSDYTKQGFISKLIKSLMICREIASVYQFFMQTNKNFVLSDLLLKMLFNVLLMLSIRD